VQDAVHEAFAVYHPASYASQQVFFFYQDMESAALLVAPLNASESWSLAKNNKQE
jgi:hypothetical protein